MFVCVPEPVCHTSKGKCSSSLPSAISCATAAMADARFRSSEPRSRLTSAAARLIRPSACTISIGMRSVPMRKLCRERCVWAPHSLFAGIFNCPNASLSTRVLGDLLRSFGHITWSVVRGVPSKLCRLTAGTSLVADRGRQRYFFRKRSSRDHFTAASAGFSGFSRLAVGCGCSCAGGSGASAAGAGGGCRRSLFLLVDGAPAHWQAPVALRLR